MKTLDIWKRFTPLPAGKWLFSRLLCFKAPYFGSIHPYFEELRPGYCAVRIAKRRSVQNHLGTVHAIAMCNMAELAAGTMTEVSVPPTHRWIPMGMTVEYLAKATTRLTAVATPAPNVDWQTPGKHSVEVVVSDMSNAIVFRATITMWVSLRKSA